MAGMFPSTPIGSIRPDALRLFRVLKRLPDSYAVWTRIDTEQRPGPDFWVRRADGCCALICASPATTAHAQSALFEAQQAPGAAESTALAMFVAHYHLPPAPELPRLVLFPNMPRTALAALGAPPAGIMWGSREELAPETLEAWLSAHFSLPLDDTCIDSIRRAIAPEVIIPAILTVRTPPERRTEAELTDYVLSYNQEWVLKHDLDLSDEAAGASENWKLQLVSGVAGSGKSLILLYRARLLRQHFPQKRILALTHNRALIRDLQSRYEHLAGDGAGVEWRTFHSWCRRHWPSSMEQPSIVKPTDRRNIITHCWSEHLADTAISPEALHDEIDWLKDRLITTREAYLAADRMGRGFGLGEGMRNRVYDAIRAYQAELRTRGLVDFGDIPRSIWRAIHEDAKTFPQYDFVLIDEAQFFAPIWFEIIKRIIKPVGGYLFMVADPTQGFLKRRQSWLASGLDVRGRTRELGTCYRTTREILSFATRFYQHRLPDDDEALVARSHRQTAAGEQPLVVQLSSEQDELTRVVNEVRVLLDRGVPPEHILVLHADGQGARRVLNRLQRDIGSTQIADPRKAPPGRSVRVCALDAAAGIESPIVLLMGAHRLIEAEDSLRISAGERAERVRDNTRRLYMAMTRAGQRLVMTYVGTPPPAFTNSR